MRLVDVLFLIQELSGNDTVLRTTAMAMANIANGNQWWLERQ
jgi:hypothetical protein